MWRKEDVVKKLRSEQGEQSLRSYATVIGCSAPYLSDIYRGRRDPGPKILKRFGLQKQTKTVVTYTKRRWQ